jgi:tripartite-type tricarboxylate transporter receptor subunit TctC
MIVGAAKPQVDAKELKLLAVVYEKRIAFSPDVPTMAEQGYKLGLSSFPVGTFVPKNVAPEKIKILPETIRKATEDGDFKAMMGEIAMPIVYDNAVDFKKLLDAKKGSTAKTFKELGFFD